MKLSQLIKNSNYVVAVNNFRDFEVKGISQDSNLIKNSFIFVAIKGMRFNGEQFISKIDKKKIIAIIISTKYKPKKEDSFTFIRSANIRKLYAEFSSLLYPNNIIEKVSVTGTNGKTSVTSYTTQIWKKKRYKSGSIGTLGLLINGKKIFDSQLTTPNPELNHKYLSILSKKECEKVICEASSIGLQQQRLYPIKFDKVAFTNLSLDHLDYHKTIRNYKKSKLLLFEEYVKENTLAIIYSDSKYSKCFINLCKKKKIEVLDYGKKAKFFRINSFRNYFDYSIISVSYKEKIYKIKVFGNSYYEVCNKICSLLIVFGKNLLPENFELIKKLSNPSGRLENIFECKSLSVFIDYAHTPHALENVLGTLKNKTQGKLLLVFGCGGERDQSKRPEMTKIALKFSDIVFITEDNPRFEDSEQIFNQMINGLGSKELKKIKIIQAREEAISQAINTTNENDILLIAGKGHENYQISKGKKKYFSDKEVALRKLKNRKNVDRNRN